MINLIIFKSNRCQAQSPVSVENYNTTSKVTSKRNQAPSKSPAKPTKQQPVQPTYRRLSSDDGLQDTRVYHQREPPPQQRIHRPVHHQEDYGMRSLDVGFYQDVATTHFTSFRGPADSREAYRDRKYVESSMKHAGNEPRLFAGRPHDILGFGKNRFNAGKYSGSNHQMQFNKNIHRHMNVPVNGHQGKVTDYVSGLY